MELALRKQRLLDNISIYFPSEYDKVQTILKNLTIEDILLEYIEHQEEKINSYKERHNKISLKRYGEKDYINFKRADVIYDKQNGYRIVENKYGLFHITLKENIYYIYPSKNFVLDIPSSVKLCNELFKKENQESFKLGEKINSNEIEPAQIYLSSDNILNNSTNYVEIENKTPKNKVIKGILKISTLNKEDNDYEDLIKTSTNFIEGTSIPYPREQKENENISHYTGYLHKHYNEHGYVITYDNKNEPIYPHEITKSKTANIEEMKTLEEKFSFEKFLSLKYELDTFENLENGILLYYLKSYKEYLRMFKTTDFKIKEYINKIIKDTELAIEDIKENRLI